MSAPVESAVAAAPEPSIWRAIWGSLRGVQHDYTSAPLPRAIILLAVPMALELLMESTFGLVDIYFVGKLGPAAVATVGLTGSLIILVFGGAIGLSIAATAVVSRRIGEGDQEGAGLSAVQAIIAGIGASIVVAIPGSLLASRMLTWMGGPPEVVAGSAYTAVLFGTSSVIFLIFLNNAIFRGAGDAALAMRALWLANALNMILDPCLIFGWGPFPEMGLVGAAWATTIGRGVGVAFQFWVLVFGNRRVSLRRDQLRYDPETMRRILRIALTGTIQFTVGTAAFLGIMRIVAIFGETTLAGYTIAIRLIHFAILPAWGMSGAAATLVGQNLGAGSPERAERAVWLTGAYNCGVLALMGLVFWTGAPQMTAFFSGDPGVVAAGVEALRIISVGYIFYAWSMSFSQGFNGAGDSDTPTYINFGVQWLIQIPLAYMLARPLGMGPRGAYVAMVVSGVIWALIGSLLFRRGKWKSRAV
jgi:putative MATE family efflux protein